MPDDTTGAISPAERVHFYHGVSEDPPPLLHQSDIMERPYVVSRFSAIPVKTFHIANHPILKNDLWKHTIGPKIIKLLEEADRGVHAIITLELSSIPATPARRDDATTATTEYIGI